jgi:hypothetical protein
MRAGASRSPRWKVRLAWRDPEFVARAWLAWPTTVTKADARVTICPICIYLRRQEADCPRLPRSVRQGFSCQARQRSAALVRPLRSVCLARRAQQGRERRDRRKVRPLNTVGPGTPLTVALTMLLEAGCSALPVVDDAGCLLDIYARADITNLCKSNSYNRMQWEDLTVAQALSQGQVRQAARRNKNVRTHAAGLCRGVRHRRRAGTRAAAWLGL